ncbi:MAG: ammonium transporter [Leptolyngbya sp. SIO4C1]|nr:ammonium transporter [Leptolyngbya sp. SIO4C1]
MKLNQRSWFFCLLLTAGLGVGYGTPAVAQSESLTSEQVQAVLDNVWVLIAAVLVIFMNAGFAMVEAGFCRRQNAVNILAKNLIVFAIATLSFWTIGFSLMFAPGSPIMHSGGFFLSGTPADYSLEGSRLTVSVFFLFQAAFAGTAATIVSGAVAERIRFISFLLFSAFLSSLVYPIIGHWIWGGGWLARIGFIDFAGSTVVHSVGGWAALTGAILLGPRLDKFQGDLPQAIPGHSLTLSVLGGFILWIGWFGFNPGSVLAANLQVPYVALTTNLSAAAGAIAATAVAWNRFSNPDLSMSINGLLAGLVAITAGCANVSPGAAVLIGAVAGSLIVFSVSLFEAARIDDPVGALSVHLVCGVWGTLAVGLFDRTYASPVQLFTQLLGVIIVGLSTVAASLLFWTILNAWLGLRVTEAAERVGLDISEHGSEAYAGFPKPNDKLDA